MSNAQPSPGREAFEAICAQFETRPGCTRSTMMGFPCLRRDGGYFVSLHKDEQSLIIKVDKTRVATLVAEGLAESFAPNGRVFKEWAAIPVAQKSTWPTRVEEAWAFAG